MTAMGRMRMTAPALVALVAALIAGCGSSQTGSASRTSAPTSTKTVTRTVVASRGSGSSSTSDSPTASPSSSTSTGTATASTATANASGASICRAAGVKLVYLGGQGATGHGLLGFAIRNTAGSPCTTIGYPGIQFESKGGGPLPTHPRHTTSDFFGKTKYGQVTVAPGQSASFRLGVTHGLASPKGCVTAASVQVIVPNDTTRLRMRIPHGVYECRGIVTVSPMQPGTSAYHSP
jgi:hypothetical protein